MARKQNLVSAVAAVAILAIMCAPAPSDVLYDFLASNTSVTLETNGSTFDSTCFGDNDLSGRPAMFCTILSGASGAAPAQVTFGQGNPFVLAVSNTTTEDVYTANFSMFYSELPDGVDFSDVKVFFIDVAPLIQGDVSFGFNLSDTFGSILTPSANIEMPLVSIPGQTLAKADFTDYLPPGATTNFQPDAIQQLHFSVEAVGKSPVSITLNYFGFMVPEPMTATLILWGGIGLIMGCRRRGHRT